MSRLPRRVVVRARAKVNLGLEVLGRRGDGYHEILTLLTAVDLADRVTLETTTGGIEVRCDAPGVPAGPANLAWRAADLVQRELPGAGTVRIRIGKAIPVAAGLGGGSADAAAVLVGLNRLRGVGLSPARLHTLATELGMDVPFFLGKGSALGSGRGEQLAPVRGSSLTLVLVNPGFPLATRQVYGRVRPEHFSSGEGVRALVAALPGGPAAIAARLVNGLEPPARELWPGLDEVKGALIESGALGAVMSGSGPTVIGVARSPAAAARIRAALADRPWRIWTTRTSARPPLSITTGGNVLLRWGVAKR